MSRKIFDFVDKLLSNSHKPMTLKVIEKLFIQGIPFNKPHGFKFKKLDQEECIIFLPYKRLNKNHLNTMHACAIATLGEFPAGLVLTKNLGSSKYRYVMTELKATYIKHANTDLRGVSQLPQKKFNTLMNELEAKGIGKIILITDILNTADEKVAVVQTEWQVKDWNKVKHK